MIVSERLPIDNVLSSVIVPVQTGTPFLYTLTLESFLLKLLEPKLVNVNPVTIMS